MTPVRFSQCAVAALLSIAAGGASAATSPTTPAPSPATRGPAASAGIASDPTYLPAGSEGWASDGSGRGVDTRWSVAPMLGFSTNGLNAGLGIRAGKTLANRVYVGGTFVYNTGESTTYFPYAAYTAYPYYYPQYATTVATASSNLFYVGPEGGYDFGLKYVVLRAYVGLGLLHTSVSYGTTTVVPTAVPGALVTGSTSATAFALWPGAAVLYDIPHSFFFVGGDLRLLIPTGGALAQGISTDPAVGFFAFGGAKFGS